MRSWELKGKVMIHVTILLVFVRRSNDLLSSLIPESE